MGVEETFGKYAAVYDEARRKFIPCFDDFYAVALRLLPRENPSPRILDLGAGTGLVSAMVLEQYPNALVMLTDISDAMLARARQRFEGTDCKVNFTVTDYTRHLPEGPFDAVVSALSIHHLTHEQKADLFRHIYQYLAPGGIFINADQALGETHEIDTYYRECWFEKVQRAGVTDEEMAGAKERMKEDRMSTLSDQLDWMKQAGFTRVNCWYKYYNFVVYSGTKACALI